MYIFAFIVLEDALDELSTKKMRPGWISRRDECVTVIRACMDLIAINPTNWDYTNKIRHALTELTEIARDNGEFAIAAQLDNAMHQLAYSEGYLRERMARAAHADT
jgi:hypothetical protein